MLFHDKKFLSKISETLRGCLKNRVCTLRAFVPLCLCGKKHKGTKTLRDKKNPERNDRFVYLGFYKAFFKG